MIFWRRPSPSAIDSFLAAQSRLDFSYAAVGCTGGAVPAGFVVDHTRVLLGHGEGIFRAAVLALKRWEQFGLGWVEMASPPAPIAAGTVVAVLARTWGLWWLNACRIVYVIDHEGAVRRFGFAYGTLPGHVARGEERFLIEWLPADDSVWYDILAYSRPNYVLTRVGYPLARRAQKRFGRESVAAMRRATQNDMPTGRA